jgi:superfamily I DNA/RNA helicase
MQTAVRRLAEAELSAKQRAIVDGVAFRPRSANVVGAGAGAGKTRTLTVLMAKALCDPTVTAVKIATMSRTARDEAGARFAVLAQRLPPGLALDPRGVRTIHSICLEHARHVAAEDGLAGVQLASATAIKEQILELVEAELRALPPPEPREPNEVVDFDVVLEHLNDLDELVTLIYNMRAERLIRREPVVDPDESLGRITSRILRALQERIACDPESKMATPDFNQLLRDFCDAGVPLAGDGEVIFVDEAQDLNRTMLGILQNTLDAGACVVVLGDDSQGIFAFSGAEDRTIASFLHITASRGIPIKKFGLFTNFRCTDKIVDVAERLLPHADRQHRVGVCGNGTTGAPVEVYSYGHRDGEGEAEAVASRIVELVRKNEAAPGDIVVLRHKNWSFFDDLPAALRVMANRVGVTLPMTIAGADAANTLSGRLLALLSAAMPELCGDGPEDVEDALVTYLRAIPSRGFTPIARRAVLEALNACPATDAFAIFVERRAELFRSFDRLLAEEIEKEKSKARAKASAEAAAAAVKGTAVGSKRKAPEDGSIKRKNFEYLIDVAVHYVEVLREFVARTEMGDMPPKVAPFTRTGQQKLKLAKEESTADDASAATTTVGRIVEIVVRDVLKPSAKDVGEAKDVVQLFNVPLVGSTVDSVHAPVAQLAGRVHDKTTAGKLIFSTIHRFKGKEKSIVFATELVEPTASLNWPRRAALCSYHDFDCSNLSGNSKLCCARFGAAREKAETGIKNELRRLQYVAASRAQQRLFLSGSMSTLNELAKGRTKAWAKAA